MRNLTSFIERENAFAEIFSRPTFDPKSLSQEDCQTLLDRLDSQLSPENLTCDGELRGADLKSKARYLIGARDDLESYAVSKHYSIISEEW
jgi:hypothetical protein